MKQLPDIKFRLISGFSIAGLLFAAVFLLPDAGIPVVLALLGVVLSLEFYKLDPTRLIVICDDISLDPVLAYSGERPSQRFMRYAMAIPKEAAMSTTERTFPLENGTMRLLGSASRMCP